jgi:GntR family transcriptional regulator
VRYLEFDNQRPIYLQILEDFKLKISNGKRKSGEKIDSVRNLAKEYEVNPNTVQRALQELEREGLCESQRTLGRFVTDNEKLIKSLGSESFELAMDEFIEKSKALKIGKTRALEKLDSYREEKDD